MISVAIVEDNENYRSVLTMILNRNSQFKINGIYSCGEDALVSLARIPPDIVIVDIKLKALSGIQLIRRLKPLLPRTQFLVCTAFQNDENVFEALKAGALGYIVKDSSPEDIQNAVTELYRGGSPMGAFIARKVIEQMIRKPGTDTFGCSERELEVLVLLSKGLLYKEISEKLFISSNTVKNHLKNIYKKLHVQNKVEAVNKYRYCMAS